MIVKSSVRRSILFLKKPYVSWWETWKSTDKSEIKNEIKNGIMDYDFEDIDRALLNTEEIKDKHLFEPGDITTSKNIERITTKSCVK